MQSSMSEGKSVRLSCRIRPRIKEQAEAAAHLLGQSITEFVETALEEKARTVLMENECILMSDRAFEEFVAAISNEPDQPSEKLLTAVANYKKPVAVVRRA